MRDRQDPPSLNDATELVWKMSANTTEQQRNEKVIRELYHLADTASKDTAKFVSIFADGGYFYDVGARVARCAVVIPRTAPDRLRCELIKTEYLGLEKRY